MGQGIIIQQIQDHLDNIIKLSRECDTLPEHVRMRGINVLTNVFQKEVDMNQLNEELSVLRNIREEKEKIFKIDADSKTKSDNKIPWYSRLFKSKLKIDKTTYAEFENRTSDTQSIAKGKYYFNLTHEKEYRPLDKPGSERFNEKQNNEVRVASLNSKKTTSLDLKSQADEKRLDGSPNPYNYRENGKFGSHPSHDDYSEDALP